MAKKPYARTKIMKPNAQTKNLRLQRKKMEKVRAKHTLGEFIYNIIHQKVELDALQEKKVKAILQKDKDFYKKLINRNTKDPLGYFRKSLKFDPQVGNGIVSLIAALAPLISSLILR